MDLLIAVYYVLVCGKYLYLICSSYEWIYQFSVLCVLACGNYSFLICGDWYKKVNKSTQTTEHVHRHHHYQTNTHSATLKPRFLEYILWCVLWLRCFGHPQNRWEYTMWKVFSTLHTSPYAHDHILRQVVPAQLCKNIWFICAVLFLCYTRVYHRCSLMPDAWVRRGEQWGLFQLVYAWRVLLVSLREGLNSVETGLLSCVLDFLVQVLMRGCVGGCPCTQTHTHTTWDTWSWPTCGTDAWKAQENPYGLQRWLKCAPYVCRMCGQDTYQFVFFGLQVEDWANFCFVG